MKKSLLIATGLLAVAGVAYAQDTGSLNWPAYGGKTYQVKEGNDFYFQFCGNSFGMGWVNLGEITNAAGITLTGENGACEVVGASIVSYSINGGDNVGTLKVSCSATTPAGGDFTLDLAAGTVQWVDGSKTYTNAAFSKSFNIEVVVGDPVYVDAGFEEAQFIYPNDPTYWQMFEIGLNAVPVSVDMSTPCTLKNEAGQSFSFASAPAKAANGGTARLIGEIPADLPTGTYTISIPQGYINFGDNTFNEAGTSQLVWQRPKVELKAPSLKIVNAADETAVSEDRKYIEQDATVKLMNLNSAYNAYMEYSLNGGETVRTDDESVTFTVPATSGEYFTLTAKCVPMDNEPDLLESPVTSLNAVIVSNLTGVSVIEAEGAEAVYFTTDGVRVNASELGNGLYIKVTGAKTSKVIR